MIEKLTALRLKEVAAKVRGGLAETLTCFSFPASQWCRIRTNKALERMTGETHCHTRVVGTFPDDKFALMLTAPRLRHIVGNQGGTKGYMSMVLLRDLDLPETHAA